MNGGGIRGEISVKFHNKLFQGLLNVKAVVTELWGAALESGP